MLSLQEVRQLGPQEFLNEMEKTKKDLMKIRFNVAAGHAKETHVLRNLKKYLAQLLTIQKESQKVPAKKTVEKVEKNDTVQEVTKKKITKKSKTIKAKK